MNDLGKVEPGQTIYIPFATYDSNDPSASATITGLAVGDIKIYKDGSVTERASTSGFTLLDTDGIDFDALTGIHGISIDLADNTTAGFYAAGSRYWVVLSSVTLDAATVSTVLATFKIGRQGAVHDTTIATLASQTSFTLTAGPAEDDALKGCVVCIHDVASAVQLGFAVVSAYTGSTKTVTLTAGTSFTAAATDNISFFPPVNTNWFGATLQAGTGANLTALATPTNITAGTITTVTNLTNLPAITSNWLTAAGIAAGALNGKGDWGDATAANQSTIVGYIDTEISTLITEMAKVPKSDSTVTWNATALASINAECDTAIADAGLTAAGISDAVWDELLSGHAVSGSAGEALSAAGTAGDPWTTALPGSYGAGTAGKIIGDNINVALNTLATAANLATVDTVVDGIQTDLSNATDGLGALKTLIDTAQADLDIITGATGVNLLAATQASIDAIEVDTSTTLPATLSTIAGYIDTEVAAIKAVTDAIPDAGALTTLLANVAAILTDTGTTLDTKIDTIDTIVDAIKAKTDSLTYTVAGQVDANIQSINDVTITGNGQTGTEFGV